LRKNYTWEELSAIEDEGQRRAFYNLINETTLQFPSVEEICQELSSGDYSVLILNNPNNPTGHFYSMEELRLILQTIKELPHPVKIIADEIFYDLRLAEAEKIPSIISVAREVGADIDDIFVFRGISKDRSLPGFRFGYLLNTDERLREKYASDLSKNQLTTVEVAAPLVTQDIAYREVLAALLQKYPRETKKFIETVFTSEALQNILNNEKIEIETAPDFDQLSSPVYLLKREFKDQEQFRSRLQEALRENIDQDKYFNELLSLLKKKMKEIDRGENKTIEAENEFFELELIDFVSYVHDIYQVRSAYRDITERVVELFAGAFGAERRKFI